MRKEFEDKNEEVEDQADEDDIELDEEVYESIESTLEDYITILKDKAVRGLAGEYTAKYKEEEKEKLKALRN